MSETFISLNQMFNSVKQRLGLLGLLSLLGLLGLFATLTIFTLVGSFIWLWIGQLIALE